MRGGILYRMCDGDSKITGILIIRDRSISRRMRKRSSAERCEADHREGDEPDYPGTCLKSYCVKLTTVRERGSLNYPGIAD